MLNFRTATQTSSRSPKSPSQKMLKELGGLMMTSHPLGGVRVAEAESSDSLRSSLINTEMDDMSMSKYEDDSPPPEVFNIIEEYPDKGRGMFNLDAFQPVDKSKFLGKQNHPSFLNDDKCDVTTIDR